MRRIRHLFIVVALLLGGLRAVHVEAQQLRAGDEVTIAVSQVSIPDICGNVLEISIEGTYTSTDFSNGWDGSGQLVVNWAAGEVRFDTGILTVSQNTFSPNQTTDTRFTISGPMTLRPSNVGESIQPGRYGVVFTLSEQDLGMHAQIVPPIDTVWFEVKPSPGALPDGIDVSACPGEEVTITLPDIVAGTNVSWVKISGGEVGLADGSGTATANGYTISFTAAENNTNAPITATYTVTADLDGCTEEKDFTVTVNPKPAIALESETNTVCSEGTVSYEFSSTVNATYYINFKEGVDILSGAAFVGNMLSQTVTHPKTGDAPYSPLTGEYNVWAESADGCVSDTMVISATVSPIPALTLLGQNSITLCYGASFEGAIYVSDVEGSVFFVNSDPVASPWQQRGDTLYYSSASVTTGGDFPIYAIANGCSSNVEIITITVNNEITSTPIPPQTVCNGGDITPVDVLTAYFTNATSYDWEITSSFTGGLSTTSETGATGEFLLQNLVNTGEADSILIVSITPKNGDCAGTAVEFEITVKPEIRITPVEDIVLCDGSPFDGINFEATPGMVTFELINNLGGNENSNGNLIFRLNNSGTGIDPITSIDIADYAQDPQSRVVQEYILTASDNNSCSVDQRFKVTVYPAGDVGISYNLAGQNTDPDYGPPPIVFGLRPDSIYPADMPIVTFETSNTSVAGFRWEKTGGDWVGLDLEGYAAVEGQGFAHIKGGWRTIKNLTGHTVCGAYRVWPVIEGENGEVVCEGEPTFFFVCVAPVPTDVENGRVDNIADIEVCSNVESPAFAFTGNLAPKGTYRWELQSIAPEGSEAIFPLIGTSLVFPSVAVRNVSGDPIVATYKVTPQYGDNILVDDSAKTFTLTILPAPAILPVITDIRAESGSTIRFELDNPDNLALEAQQVSGDHVGELSITNNIFGGIAATNTGNETLAAIYQIIPKYTEDGCAGQPRLFTVYVDPAGLDNLITNPVESQTVCYGAGLEDINFSSYRTDDLDLPATSYLVEFVDGVDVINLGVNTDLQLVNEYGLWAISGVSDLISGTGTYRVTPRSENGEGKPVVFTLTVGANLDAIELALEGRTYKNGDQVPVFPLTSGAIVLPEGVSIVWRHNGSSDVLENSQHNGSNEIPAFKAVNTGSTPLTAIFDVEIVGPGNCIRTLEGAFSITVLPNTVEDLDLVMREIEDITICSGDEISIPDLVAYDRITGNNYEGGVTFDVRLTSGVDVLAGNNTNLNPEVISGSYMVIPFLNNNQGVPETFTISVKPAPMANQIANITTVNGAHVDAINLTGIGNSFIWEAIGDFIGSGLSGTNTIEAFTAINPGNADSTATFVVIPMFDNCEGEWTMEFSITVKPNTIEDLDLVMREIEDITICSGEEIPRPALVAYDRITGNNYEEGVTFDMSLISGVDFLAKGSDNIATDVISSTYMVIPFLNNNQGVPETFTINVNPVPVANQIANITTVNGAHVDAINLTGIGTAFGWSATGNEIGSGRLGVNTIEAFTALNPGNADSIATFTVIPRFRACEGEPMTFSITVKPNTIEDLDLVMRAIEDIAICSGEEIPRPALVAYDRITGNNYEEGVTFDMSLISGVDVLAKGSDNIATDVISGTYMVIPFLNNNQGVPETFTISVNPVPVANQIANITTVNGAHVNAINLTGIGTAFGWSATGNEIGSGRLGVNTIEAFTALNPGNADSIATFTVIPRFRACEGEPMTFSITVKPATIEDMNLVANPVESQYACSGDELEDINFSAYRTDGGDLTEVSYLIRFIGGTDVINLGGNPEYKEVPADADGLWEISNLTELNAGTGTYSVTPRSMNGEGAPVIFTLTIGFNLNFISLSAIEDRIYKNGDHVPAFPLTSIAALPEGVSVAWKLNDMSQPLPNLQSEGVNTMPAFEAVNTGSVAIPASFDLQLIDNTTGCQGEVVRNAFSIIIMPNTIFDPDFAMNGIENQTVCSGAPIADIAYSSSYRFADLEGFDPADAYYETKLLSGVHVLANATADIAGTDAGYTGNVIENQANVAVSGVYIVTPLWRNKEGKPSTFTITVLPVPTVIKPLDQVLCNNSMSRPVLFNGSAQGTQYSWTVVDADGNPTSSKIGLPGGVNIGDMPAYQILNTTGDQAVDTIEVVPGTAISSESGAFCYGASATFTIAVNPTPVVTPIANITVNPGATVSAINIAGRTDAAYTTYKWTNSNTLIGLNQTEGTNTIPEFTATNESNGKLQSVITVYPSYTKDGLTCNGEAITFTIIVNAKPGISPIEDRIVCNGEKVAAIDLQSRVTDAVYFTWTSSVKTIGLADNPEPASQMKYIPAFIAVYDESLGNGNDPIVSTVTVTPFVSSNGIISEGAPFSFTISVKPTTRILVQPFTPEAICETQSVSLSVVASGYNLSYQWYRNGAPIGRSENESALTANLVIDEATISDAGDYFVQIAGDCNAVESAAIDVEVNLNPSLIVQKWNDILMVNTDANTNGGHNFTSYQWFKNGNRLAGEVMPNYHETSANTNDIYQVALNTPSGTLMSCPTRLQVFDSNIMLSAYPNPVFAGEIVTVEARLPSTSDLNTLKLQVINASGNVYSLTAGTGAYTQVTMPTTPGVYVLRAIYEDSNQGSVLREFKVIVK